MSAGTGTPQDVAEQAARRRTFAVISHPDAGKSTLTEALALHAAAIEVAGAVHGKAGRGGVRSDWMEMERARGISITSSVLRFEFDGALLNLLDTPGHADFSEDTYRVLAAVDAAIMLLDSAKGLEAQTLKLFDVCRHRRVPVITFVNKWDRPGREPLELLDEIEQRIGLRPAPLTWPVGTAGDFRGLIDRADRSYTRFRRTPGGATRAIAERVPADRAAAEEGEAWRNAVEELALLDEIGATLDPDDYAAGICTPVLFGAALPNFGVSALLETVCRLAPSPSARMDADGRERPVTAPFSGQVFKVQAGMDRAHRDRLAFIRICSGRFERGMSLVHAPTGRPLATKYAQTVFGRDRSTLDTAYPGDVIGLPNATGLTVGDTLYARTPVTFPPIPAFAPEHFMVARVTDNGRAKQFRRGIDQLDSEGVVQVLRSDLRGDQAPVLAAVGPLQFDVFAARMADEFNAPVTLNRLDYSTARITDKESADTLNGRRGVEVLTRTLDGALVAVFVDKWRLRAVEREHPGVTLTPMLAAGDSD
ncbi:peptide chain release factor 3 (bRF-3) [Actinomadura pelletieri DSM 43383]|uniref:Peptide chain release factor 3 n=1 Tax=Actinomadura pelletieri DSM 43383 TaxID=1120940 RepID=A0A495QXZ4_9ACTN|nr:peptide chain release factor 3 [Actinomadura pelletieri]RKS78927.1 peptide chain release factor 3 (bRF-3) [Actinomadura pelletieri DSM 43383]